MLHNWLNLPAIGKMLVLSARSGVLEARKRVLDALRVEDLTGPKIMRFTVEPGNGGQLRMPFELGRFDLVVCQYLSSLTDIEANILSEVTRVIASGGALLIVDYAVPGSRLRGKRARLQQQAGAYINAWFRLLEPGHARFLDEERWQDYLVQSALTVQRRARCQSTIDFGSWSHSRTMSNKDRIRLEVMLRQAPENVRGFLTPDWSGDRITFRMTTLAILASVANRAP